MKGELGTMQDHYIRAMLHIFILLLATASFCYFYLLIIFYIVSCETLQSTTDIIVKLTSTAIGSNATYQCRDGSSDVYTTQCTSDGVWEPNPNSTLDCTPPGTMLASYPCFSTCIWMPLYTTSLSFQCCVKFFNPLKIP